LFADAATTLQLRAREFHGMLYEKTCAIWDMISSGEWYATSKRIALELYGNICGILGRIFHDAGKAADHVATRATEATESVPHTASAVSTVVYTVVAWIVDSWISLGAKLYAFAHPGLIKIQEYTQIIVCAAVSFAADAYAVARRSVAGTDDLMRGVACTACAYASMTYKSVLTALSTAGVGLYQQARAAWFSWFAPQAVLKDNTTISNESSSESSDTKEKKVGMKERALQYAHNAIACVREYASLGTAWVHAGAERVAQLLQAVYNKAYMSLVTVTVHEAAPGA
jgi:hypothetical protein